MSDDEADPELLALLRESLGIGLKRSDEVSEDTGVLKDAEYIYRNSIDVIPDMLGTRSAALQIYKSMQERQYSTTAWSQHDFHPSREQGFSDLDMVNFIFTMDLLNFSFWSEEAEDERFQVQYQGQRCTGYKSLVAAIRRGLDEGVPITTPSFWRREEATSEVYESVFRSATAEAMPMLQLRVAVLREAAEVLDESFPGPDVVDELDQQIGDVQPAIEPETAHAQAEPATEMDVDPKLPSHDTVPALGMDNTHQETTHGKADQTEQMVVEKDTTALANGAVSDAELSGEKLPPTHPTHLEPHNTQSSAEEKPTIPPAPLEPQAKATSPADQPHPFGHLPPDHSVVRLIQSADHSAGKLVSLLAKHFPCFRDEARFDGRRVRFLKRAQIFVADLWAAFQGTGYGEFRDIGHLTMFADYRVPQMLHSLGVLTYSPSLHYRIRDLVEIPSGHSWEVQLRGCSIWAVEMIRREIVSMHPETEVNAVMIDFFLYDLAKEKEKEGGGGGLTMPHHRTRSIWY